MIELEKCPICGAKRAYPYGDDNASRLWCGCGACYFEGKDGALLLSGAPCLHTLEVIAKYEKALRALVKQPPLFGDDECRFDQECACCGKRSYSREASVPHTATCAYALARVALGEAVLMKEAK